MACAGGQVFDFAHALARARRADLDIAEVEPEFVRSRIGQRNGDRNRVVTGLRLLDESDDFCIVDLRKAQAVGLLQCRVAAAQPVQMADIALDVSRLVPVAHLHFVFLGIEIFLPTGNGVVFEQLESIIDAVVT